MAEPVAVRVVIHGRVQGVWFRGWTEREARALGLSGWVRNLSDGTVEALFSGAPDAVRAMIGKCRGGPPAANVTNIEEFAADRPDGSGFKSVRNGWG